MAETVTDPVCGMQIRPEEAAASEEYQGRTIYFCSPGCSAAFVEDPDRYTRPQDQ
jgi:YHS domain-containing protein